MFRNGDDYLGFLLTEGPPAARCEWLRALPSDDFGPRALARRREDDQSVVLRGIAIADAAWRRTSPRLQALAAVEESHVSALLAYGRHEGLAYFIHEHHDAPRLTTVLREQGGCLALRVVLPLFAQVLEACGDAHRRGVVVGGVRPQDIRVVQTSGDVLEIRLRNFGLAAVLGVPAGRSGATDHPSIYRAPEPDVSKHASSDVFSLGVLFIRLLTGPLPQSDDDEQRQRLLRDRLQRAQQDTELDDGLAIAIAACVDLDRGARPRDAVRLLERMLGVVPEAALHLSAGLERSADEGDEHWPARQWTVLDAWERPRSPQPGAQVQPNAVMTESGRAIDLPRAAFVPKPGGTQRVAPLPSRAEAQGRALRRVALAASLVSIATAAAIAVAVIVSRDEGDANPSPSMSETVTKAAVEPEPVDGVDRVDLSLGTLFVETTPPATLTIDGEERGRTTEAVRMRPGVHLVRVEAEGHRAWRSRVDIEAGREHRVVVILEPEPSAAAVAVPVAIAVGHPGSRG